MLSLKLKIRLTLLAAIFSWLLFVFFDIYWLLVDRYEMHISFSHLLPQLFLAGFTICMLLYFRFIINKAESINFIDLLWRVFLTGLITTVMALLVRLFFNVFRDSSIIQNEIIINILYHVIAGLVTVFLISTFVVWKRLILYQKSKGLIQLWNFFEYALLGSLAFDLFNNKFLTPNFNIFLVFLLGFALVLSFNLKWIAYLNFRQKWKSILFILLSGIYVYHFITLLLWFSATNILTIDLLDRVFIVALLVFIILYAAISVLVALFNLPTSSVFERKLQEAIDFQKLSQAIPSGQSTEQTYDILLDSSMNAVFADAAWLEIHGSSPSLITRSIGKATVNEIKGLVKAPTIKGIIDADFDGDLSYGRISGSLKHPAFKSIIALPIVVKGVQEGTLVLLQEVSDAFNREMVNIIVTFVSQASVALENVRLLTEALENERYKEQLKIAKTVQKGLLPSVLSSNQSFSIDAASFAADEVGGDYYDIIEKENGLFKLIIADVSGKGTSAAFNMAQLKGVFHSLTQGNRGPEQFIKEANAALSGCMEPSSFITASYFEIDTDNKEIKFVRAGHCPTLYYKQDAKEATFLQTEGLGLGIIRNSEYDQYVDGNSIGYEPGDILILYTDGITEARNKAAEQYGQEGLKRALLAHRKKTPADLRNGIIEDLHQFLDGKTLDDDYTLVIVRFL